MPTIRIYRTPLDNPFVYSLFGGKTDPRSESAAESLYQEETLDPEGRLLSQVKYDERGKPSYTRTARYGGALLAEEREEFAETGAVVLHVHAYEGTRETIRVLFDGELDEEIVREFGENGKPIMERAEDSKGVLKRLTKFDAEGNNVYEETPKGIRRFEYRGEGEERTEVSISENGTETWEKRRTPREGVEEIENYESGNLTGTVVVETFSNTTRITGRSGNTVYYRGYEERDAEGRVVRSDHATRGKDPHFIKNVETREYYGDGKLKARWSTIGLSDYNGGDFRERGISPKSTHFEEWEYDDRGRPAALLITSLFEQGLDLEPDAFYRFEYGD